MSVGLKVQENTTRLVRAAIPVLGGTALFSIVISLLLIGLERTADTADNPILNFALSSVLVLIVFGAAVSAYACFLLRKTILRQKELIAAQQEGSELRKAYEQVVENLPVGLFTYSAEGFGYTNWTWDAQILREPGELPLNAFKRAVHPEDRIHVLNELARCCEREEPAHLQFRIINSLIDQRLIELRAAPIYEPNGEFRHLLGFNMDVSQLAHANAELQGSNEELDRKNLLLTEALADLEVNFTAMVESLVKAVEAKDPYTAGHSERVMHYCLMIGACFDLHPQEMKILKMGSLVHDIGKIGIPDEILTKPSGLTREEYEIIKRHPETGYEMIQGIPIFRDCAPIIRFHHERLDGSGYPLGLKGDEIPFLVRISSVADIFDAMTSNRAYRRGLPIKVAIEELRHEARLGKIDAEIVEAFAAAIMKEEIPSNRNWPQAA